jgi:hypothetical protein
MKLFHQSFLLLLVLNLTHQGNPQASKNQIHEQNIHIMEEEYKVVRQMRHKLKYLLEQQDAENKLQQSEDVFQVLQQFEQWLEQMKQNPGNANLESLMKMLQQLEQRMNESLAAQEQTHEWLNSNNSNKPINEQRQIPLSNLMEAIRELIQQKRFDEAQQLLDQLISAMNRKQQNLQQALAENKQQRFSKTSKELQKIKSQAEQALAREKHILKMLQPHQSSEKLSGETGRQSANLQRQISELIRGMQSGMMKLPESLMLNTRSPKRELQLSQQASDQTERNLQNFNSVPAFQSAGATKHSLERLTQNLSNLQQQVQQIANGEMISQRDGKERRYWSEKSIRKMKFEYEFKANPIFRERIQEEQVLDSQRRSNLEQEYLQEIIR